MFYQVKLRTVKQTRILPEVRIFSYMKKEIYAKKLFKQIAFHETSNTFSSTKGIYQETMEWYGKSMEKDNYSSVTFLFFP